MRVGRGVVVLVGVEVSVGVLEGVSVAVAVFVGVSVNVGVGLGVKDGSRHTGVESIRPNGLRVEPY